MVTITGALLETSLCERAKKLIAIPYLPITRQTSGTNNVYWSFFFIAAQSAVVLSNGKPSSAGTSLTAALIKTAKRNAIYLCVCVYQQVNFLHTLYLCSPQERLLVYKEYTDRSFSCENNVFSIRYGQNIYIQSALGSALNSFTIPRALNKEQ
jgi:hypothetical protein